VSEGMARGPGKKKASGSATGAVRAIAIIPAINTIHFIIVCLWFFLGFWIGISQEGSGSREQKELREQGGGMYTEVSVV